MEEIHGAEKARFLGNNFPALKDQRHQHNNHTEHTCRSLRSAQYCIRLTMERNVCLYRARIPAFVNDVSSATRPPSWPLCCAARVLVERYPNQVLFCAY
jgi:hypothetical protein